MLAYLCVRAWALRQSVWSFTISKADALQRQLPWLGFALLRGKAATSGSAEAMSTPGAGPSPSSALAQIALDRADVAAQHP